MNKPEKTLFEKLKVVIDSGEKDAISNAVNAINASYTYVNGHMEAAEQEREREEAQKITLVKAPKPKPDKLVEFLHPFRGERL